MYLFFLLPLLAALPAGALHEPGHGRSSFPRLLPPALGERALFEAQAADAFVPCLGSTDGTTAGTGLFPQCVTPSSNLLTVSFDDRKYLSAVGESGLQMWASDGTADGTYPLTDFAVFTPSGDAAVDFDTGLLALFGDDGPHGRQIWLSDGLPGGSRMLLDPLPGAEGSTAYGLHFHQGRLYFAGDHETPQQLWRSDPALTTAAPFLTLPDGHRLLEMPWTPADRMVFVTGDDECRQRIWSSDGTAAGTSVLMELAIGCPGAVRRIVYRSPRMYFLLDDGVHGVEAWASDGHGVQRITDLPWPEPFPRRFFWPVEVAGGLSFIADGGPDVGVELWWTDGTPAGTRMVKDVCPGGCSALNEVTIPAVVGGRIFLVADDGAHGWEVWASDGTAAGTVMIADLCPGVCPELQITSLLATERDFLLVVADDGIHGRELWRLDPQQESLLRLTDFATSVPFNWLAVADLPPGIVFAADDGVHGSELWITDGSVAGTRLLANLAVEPPEANEPPARPSDLSAQTATSGDVVDLTWSAGAGGGPVESWTVEARSPRFEWTVVTFAVAGDPRPETGFARAILETGTPYTFRVRADNAAGPSPWSEEVSLTTPALFTEDPCLSGDHLCLAGNRFLVQVEWRNQRAASGTVPHGVGHPIPAAGSDRSGYFWFFKPDNVELVVKVLNGTPVNGFHWTFYGALTDVEYWITVTDLVTLDHRTYHNPPGEICGRGDTRSLPASSTAAVPAQFALPLDATAAPAQPVLAGTHPPEPCVEDATTLCLLDGRYRVRVEWDDHRNQRQGVGGAVPFSNRSGFFWFFNPQNIELVVKMLDGTPVNGRVWVFYGALSDVGYTIEVFDLQDGHTARRYVNPPGNICGRADTAAF